MGRHILPTILLFLGIGIVSAIGLSTKPEELKNSPEVIETNSLEPIHRYLRIFHGDRVNDLDNDRDFDGDGINDSYVMGRDGAAYATHSSDRGVPLFRERFYKHKKAE